MKNKSYRVGAVMCRRVLAGAGVSLALVAGGVRAQNANPFAPAPSGAMDTLSGIGTPGTGAAERAREAVKTAEKPAAPGAAAPANFGVPAAMRGGRAAGAVRDASKAVQRVVIPRVKAIVGTRVFDAVSGELLDDAQLINVDQAEIQSLGLVDDGTNGDRQRQDGEYAKVETTREYIGQANQRLKERLIQAIYSAEQLDPLEFYGFNLMTTERATSVPRNRHWTLVNDPNGGVGRKMAEVASEKPVEVPKYREWEQERDRKLAGKDGWAVRFLDEYRTEKGKVDSDFYTIYIPMPPVTPGVPPPPAWSPFPNPSGVAEGGAAGGGASQFSKQGYKVKTPPGGLPPGAGAAAQPYLDKGMTDKMFR